MPYASPNAPKVRDVLGTTMPAGHKRYAQISALRFDGVLPELLGIEKVVSEDVVRHALKREIMLASARQALAHAPAACLFPHPLEGERGANPMRRDNRRLAAVERIEHDRFVGEPRSQAGTSCRAPFPGRATTSSARATVAPLASAARDRAGTRRARRRTQGGDGQPRNVSFGPVEDREIGNAGARSKFWSGIVDPCRH